MKDLQKITKKRLRKLIKETQHTLDELQEELERRNTEKKEHEILDLEQHLSNAESRLTSIRGFMRYLIDKRK